MKERGRNERESFVSDSQSIYKQATFTTGQLRHETSAVSSSYIQPTALVAPATLWGELCSSVCLSVCLSVSRSVAQ